MFVASPHVAIPVPETHATASALHQLTMQWVRKSSSSRPNATNLITSHTLSHIVESQSESRAAFPVATLLGLVSWATCDVRLEAPQLFLDCCVTSWLSPLDPKSTTLSRSIPVPPFIECSRNSSPKMYVHQVSLSSPSNYAILCNSSSHTSTHLRMQH